jgi:hypothetical protein
MLFAIQAYVMASVSRNMGTLSELRLGRAIPSKTRPKSVRVVRSIHLLVEFNRTPQVLYSQILLPDGLVSGANGELERRFDFRLQGKFLGKSLRGGIQHLG